MNIRGRSMTWGQSAAMADYEIGFGKPPKHTRFKPGKSGNPKGRPPRGDADPLGEVVQGVLDSPVPYRENGRNRTATWNEIRIKGLIKKALHGDVAAASTILEERKHALKHGDADTIQIEVTDWLPEFLGQTAEQKTATVSGAAATRPRKPGRQARAVAPEDQEQPQGGDC